MATPPVPKAKVEAVVEAYTRARGPERAWTRAARACGYSEGKQLKSVIERWVPFYGLSVPERRFEMMTHMERAAVELAATGHQPAADQLYETPPFHVSPLPEDDLPIEEIIAHRKREFMQKQKHEEARRLIPITIKIDGAIALNHMGDPHVDDDGTDIVSLEAHSNLTRTVEGFFAANVGDTTNNWVGRLAKLYADQNMGRRRAIKFAEWFIRRTVWLYMIGGNHDGWSGQDDPIKWIAKQVDALYQPSEARLALNFPNGEQVIINARHDFAGSSQWNPTHGPMKAIQLGLRDDVAVCGHFHKSGYGVLKDPDTGKVCHALQVASYKIYDRYAKEKGFRDQSLSPAACTVIDPDIPRNHPDRIKLFWDPHEGADYLTFKRKRQKSQAKPAAKPKPRGRR